MANFLVNLAYFTKDLPDKQVEDEIQSLVHVLHNTFRIGGDSLAYDTPILLEKDGRVEYKSIGAFCEGQGLGQIPPGYRALSVNAETGLVSFKPVYATIRHENPSKFVEIELVTGHKIVVTDNHSMLSLGKDGAITVVAPKDNPQNIIMPRYFNFIGIQDCDRMFYDPVFARILGYYAAWGHADGDFLVFEGLSRGQRKYIDAYFSDKIQGYQSRYEKCAPKNACNAPWANHGVFVCAVGLEMASLFGELCGYTQETKHLPQCEFPFNAVGMDFVSGFAEVSGLFRETCLAIGTMSPALARGLSLLLLQEGIVHTKKPLILGTGTKMPGIVGEWGAPYEVLRIPGEYVQHKLSFVSEYKTRRANQLAPWTYKKYTDYSGLRDKIDKVYRRFGIAFNAYGRRWMVTQEMLAQIERDLVERLDIAEQLPEPTTAEEARYLADVLLLPKSAYKYSDEGWGQYDLRYYGEDTRKGFLQTVQVQLAAMQELKGLVRKSEQILPIKVKSITYLPDQQYSYDISVEGNENFLAGDNMLAHNSPFTNVSLFCRGTLQGLFSGGPDSFPGLYPDGSLILDNVDEIMRVQKLFAEFIAKGAPTGIPYRFPVCAVNIKTDKAGKIIDTEFFEYMARLNADRAIFNWHQGEKLASCCLTPSTKVLSRVDGEVRYGTVAELYATVERGKAQEIELMGEEKFVPVTGAIKLAYKDDILNIKLANGMQISVTKDHPSVRLVGGRLEEVVSENLRVGDILPVAKVAEYDSPVGDFNLGRFVGLYLAEGWAHTNDSRDDSIIFAINKQREDLQDFILHFGQERLGGTVRITPHPSDAVVKLAVKTPAAYGLVKNFVLGKRANDKRLACKAFNTSKEFRSGLLSGFIDGDGFTSDPLRADYGAMKISSKELAKDIIALANTLGISCMYHEYIYNHNPWDRHQKTYVYTVNFGLEFKQKIPTLADAREPARRTHYQRWDSGDYYGVPIVEIVATPPPSGEISVYDFEVDTESHLFQIWNGIITHNCRLTSSLSDLKKYAKVDSFGNGGASLGSHRVITLNLHRAALLSAGEQNPVEVFKKNVRWMADAARDLLIAHKFNILEPAVEKGMIPSFKIGWADMSMFFSTIGYTGLYDAFNVIYPGGTLDEYRKFAGITLDFLDLLTTQYSLDSAGAAAFNVEEIPGEGACPLLAKKDRYMFPGKTSLAILSNQMLPLYEQFDMFDRLEVAGELMNKVSGGAILHLNLSSPMTPDASVALSKLLLEKYKITHWAANYGFTVCRKTGEVHTTVGIHKQCPVCGNAENISYITRVVGFNTEVKDWNLVRRTLDFPNRQWGDIDYILKGRD